MNFNKTDEELKQMSEDELMEYLDAKAEHLKQYTKPLSGYKTKKYAFISSAISGEDINYKNVKNLSKKNEKKAMDYFFDKKNKE